MLRFWMNSHVRGVRGADEVLRLQVARDLQVAEAQRGAGAIAALPRASRDDRHDDHRPQAAYVMPPPPSRTRRCPVETAPLLAQMPRGLQCEGGIDGTTTRRVLLAKNDTAGPGFPGPAVVAMRAE